MDTTLKSRLMQFWFYVQEGLFLFLAEMDVELTPPTQAGGDGTEDD